MPPRPGAFAELTRIPERNIIAIPDSLPIAHAALAEPIAVAWHAVKLGMSRLHQPLAACRIVVLGGGAIGLACGLVARHFGAHDIAIGETNALRREALQTHEQFATYIPGGPDAPGDNSVDLVIDAVGASATRAASCAMARPGSVIVHVGLLPGHEGLDIRKITLQEITLTGSYCYTPSDFEQTVQALVNNQLGQLAWAEEWPLSEGAAAFAAIDAGTTAAAKIVLRPDA